MATAPVSASESQQTASIQITRATSEKARSVPLDFLRGFAILLVIGHHSLVVPGQAGYLEPFFRAWSTLGWTGVDLFFVLSGFLIGGLLFHEIQTRQTLDIKRFIIRRGFRIWPLYYLYLVLVTLLAIKHEHSIGAGFASVWTNWFHLQNYTILGHSTPLYHTWSLAVEEHFYLALPLLLLLSLRGKKVIQSMPIVPIMAGVLLTICLVMRLLHPGQFTPQSVQYPTHLRIDSLFFGVTIAYLSHFHRDVFQALERSRVWLLLAGIALISPMAILPLENRFVYTVGFTMLSLGYGAILIALLSFQHLRIWRNPVIKAIAFVGFFSYPIYLFHIGFGRAAEGWFLTHIHYGSPELIAVSATFVFIASATLAGVVLGKLVEKPTLAIRDRLFPSREKPANSPGPAIP